MSAMSGGCPPVMAVESTVVRLFPSGLYLTVTFGYTRLKALITAPKAVASEPVQIPSKLTVPETDVAAAVVVVVLDADFLLPHPAATTTTAMSRALATHFPFISLPSRSRR